MYGIHEYVTNDAFKLFHYRDVLFLVEFGRDNNSSVGSIFMYMLSGYLHFLLDIYLL